MMRTSSISLVRDTEALRSMPAPILKAHTPRFTRRSHAMKTACGSCSASSPRRAAFDNPDLIVACVVGDGESETCPLEGSWKSVNFVNPARDGAVLPILHLNGRSEEHT